MKKLSDFLFLIAVDAIEYKANKIFYNIYFYKNIIEILIHDNRKVIKTNKNIYENLNIELLKEYITFINGKIEIKENLKDHLIKIRYDITNNNAIPIGFICEKLFMLSPSIDIRVNFLSYSFQKCKILYDMTNSLIFDYQILETINKDIIKVNYENRYF